MILKFNEFIKESNSTQKRIDSILDKISANGIDSLSDDEKRFLDGDIGAQEVGIDLYDDVDSYNFIDSSGNYIDTLDKNNFVLKVSKSDSYLSKDIEVFVYEKTGKYMVEENFSDMLFPELKSLGLDDVEEGIMLYRGRYTVDELVNKLKSMGFNTIKK